MEFEKGSYDFEMNVILLGAILWRDTRFGTWDLCSRIPYTVLILVCVCLWNIAADIILYQRSTRPDH